METHWAQTLRGSVPGISSSLVTQDLKCLVKGREPWGGRGPESAERLSSGEPHTLPLRTVFPFVWPSRLLNQHKA